MKKSKKFKVAKTDMSKVRDLNVLAMAKMGHGIHKSTKDKMNSRKGRCAQTQKNDLKNYQDG